MLHVHVCAGVSNIESVWCVEGAQCVSVCVPMRMGCYILLLHSSQIQLPFGSFFIETHAKWNLKKEWVKEDRER